MTDAQSGNAGTTWIRQFSLRLVLTLTAGCAVVSLLLASSVRGSWWAIGVVAALVALLVVMVVHALVFGCVWLLVTAVPRPRRTGRKPVTDRPPDDAASGSERRTTP
jgi:bacteriorhodopsin